MHLRKVLFAVAVIVVISFSLSLTGQGLVDGIKVTLPHPVILNDKVLEPGEYEIRRSSTITENQALTIFSKDKAAYQTVALTIPVEDQKTPEESKVILHHIGENYYFDKIWIEGKDFGYEFVLPDKVKALQRELAVTVPAKYEPTQPASENAAESRAGSAREAENVNANSRPAVQDPRAGLDRQADLDRQAQAAERDRQLQAEREAPQVAALQQEERIPAAQPQSQPQSQVRSETSAAQPQQESRPNVDQLPATATNWLAYVLGGVLLVSLSACLRFRPQE